jgi:DNA-binding transcriptional LysR family regulator
VILGGSADPRVEARLLCMSEIGCVLPPGHPLTRRRSLSLTALADVPLISLSPQQPVGALVRETQGCAEAAARIAIEVSQSSIACALVRSGAGVAILDGFGLAEAKAQGLVVRPLLPRIPLEVTVVISRTRIASRLAVAFAEVLADAAIRVAGAPAG